VDNALHARSTLKGVIDRAELHEVKMGIELILYRVREEKIFINSVSHS
jgi:hypothetical protein